MSARIVIGLGFGDEGKGTVVDHLAATAHRPPLVVRFSGGAQAAHNVITETGLHHTFSQFGAGSFRGAATLLSKHVLVDPLRLYQEHLSLSEQLQRNSLDFMFVDGRAPLVTRIHQAINRARERARGADRHGSTGLGVGETEAYRLLAPATYPVVSDLEVGAEGDVLLPKLTALYEWGVEQVGELDVKLDDVHRELMSFGESQVLTILTQREVRELLWAAPDLIFEGSQGVLLDEWVGFHPHTTWSTITPDNAYSILREAGLPPMAHKIGVTRTYTTRHGAGPFPTEDASLAYPELHNAYGEFQGGWRVGHLDLTLLAYAARAVMPDALAITHMDVEQAEVAATYDSLFPFAENVKRAADKEWQEGFTQKLMAYKPTLLPLKGGNREVRTLIEETIGVEAGLLSFGPSSADKVDLS